MSSLASGKAALTVLLEHLSIADLGAVALHCSSPLCAKGQNWLYISTLTLWILIVAQFVNYSAHPWPKSCLTNGCVKFTGAVWSCCSYCPSMSLVPYGRSFSPPWRSVSPGLFVGYFFLAYLCRDKQWKIVWWECIRCSSALKSNRNFDPGLECTRPNSFA